MLLDRILEREKQFNRSIGIARKQLISILGKESEIDATVHQLL
jgi:hypothetical protein